MTGKLEFALDIQDVTKTFPGVTALSDVSLQVLPGEVHALVGENGAGKSTLMAVAAGALTPDAGTGTIRICGSELIGVHPTRARELGLTIVYQHPALLPDLTVAENFLLGVSPEHRSSIRSAVSWTRESLEASGAATVNPRARVDSLNSGQRQLVEIARAIAGKPSVLVLDEPTEALTKGEIDVLFENIGRLKQGGTAVVYISHRIPDVKHIADRVTLLRDGKTRGTFDADAISEDEIVRLIVGRSIDAAFPDKAAGLPKEPVLHVQGMTGHGFTDVDLDVAPGEIVGLAGIDGNGQADFIRALAGVSGATATSFAVRGKRHRLGSVNRAQAAGIVYMPGDKLHEGLFVKESVRVNASLLALRGVSSGGVISKSRERETFAPAMTALAVKTPDLETRIGSLSGGNQQKVVLARALSANPDVLLVEEPTQGVDAGVRVEMYRNLREVASDGNGVVVLSSDGLELSGLCDRVLVFSRGHVIKELRGEEVSEEAITQTALTSTALRAGTEQKTSGRIRSFLAGDYGPSVVLIAALLGLVAYTNGRNPLFLGDFNIVGMALLAATLIIVAYGQLAVVVTGGIDLSVGPLIGTCTVVASFLVVDGKSAVGLIGGIGAVIGVGAAVGLANAVLIRVCRLTPIVATLVTFTLLQGFGLYLRDTAGGSFNTELSLQLQRNLGGVPIVLFYAVGAALLLELVLKRTLFGMRLRGVGSDEVISQKLGTSVTMMTIAAYVICSVCAALASFLVIASIGLGDAHAGATYTFASITAVILAGAAITGGRGSFIATMLGAVLIQVVLSATTFLELEQYWQSYMTGALMLVAAAAFSLLRRRGV